jgi:hypothetical protein
MRFIPEIRQQALRVFRSRGIMYDLSAFQGLGCLLPLWVAKALPDRGEEARNNPLCGVHLCHSREPVRRISIA